MDLPSFPNPAVLGMEKWKPKLYLIHNLLGRPGPLHPHHGLTQSATWNRARLGRFFLFAFMAKGTAFSLAAKSSLWQQKLTRWVKCTICLICLTKKPSILIVENLFGNIRNCWIAENCSKMPFCQYLQGISFVFTLDTFSVFGLVTGTSSSAPVVSLPFSGGFSTFTCTIGKPKRGIGFSEAGATSRIHFTQIKIVNFKSLQLGESRREPELNSRSPSRTPHRSLPTKQCSSLSPSSVFNPPNNPPRS